MLKIEKIQDTIDVFDIQTERTHCFFANDILVHNCEILQPNVPLESANDEKGEIGICILSAINILETKRDEIPQVCQIIVSLLNRLIDYQLYPFPAAQRFCQNKRSLAVGVTNFAAWLASQGVNHESEESIKLASDLMEEIQYGLLSASCSEAEQNGPAKDFYASRYSEGWLPIDFHSVLPEDIQFEYNMDWEDLRSRIKKFGLANCTVSAQMPCESCLKSDTIVDTELGPMNFHDICENGGVDWEDIEQNNKKGWYSLNRSIKINNNLTDKIYYNGKSTTIDLTLEDGSTIKCTRNHRFLTKTGWKRAADLTVNDEILEKE